ncbi:PAS domain-containing protein [Thalassobaculum litoreum]|uniref:PAS domain S-box-containing protein n=1 Tax=Thalassobaculum litoreum DSM 18839 TaxID=1123362 RepID=A0A8G2EXB3_9PROT|nr:PAS domain-containing protein [Thalassobaculum litoreum]SDG59745.1 PAS domain S-box-containing protein [Thalassobaculum litoreum DSM 18839]
MAKHTVSPTNREVFFGDDEIIVSKTDSKGRITYANDVFMRISGYSVDETLGQPHSFIRHPDMPRSVFKLLWDAIEAKGEIFAYVKNMTKIGDHYWVLAHVTASLDRNGSILGYHSNRRKPDPAKVKIVSDLYRNLKQIEDRPNNRKDSMAESYDFLSSVLIQKGVSYDEFVLTL